MLNVYIPEKTGIFAVAAKEFSSFYTRMTGDKVKIVTKPATKGDMVVFGSDAVSAYTHSKIIDKTIPQFSIITNSDEYQIVSAEENGRNLLFFAGGRPRAMLYAVYHFFEENGCRYFWDGDIVPEKKTIALTGWNLKESPRFEYRGLRYFAHRSLKRFQAEHWDMEDWQKEIDWCLKKRFNLFMLRIGIDDLFQKAFPDIVPYPEGFEVSSSKPRSYDDHTLFWKLEYRGELRKKILAYARERDMLHPEDLGTMTHWYSRTPQEYLDKVNPDFMPQATRGYGDKSGLVWDIRQEKNLDAYWKLTETHIKEYGSPELFHTIGLAERKCYSDRAANHQMKLYAYRRIQKKLREHYPNAPLLIASWDFCMYWEPEEVVDLVKEFDPNHTLILDYTSDTDDDYRTFQTWDLCGKFPYIFGIFHAFEPNSEPRGNYAAIERRLAVAGEDAMCKGMIYWPENSHSDTLLLEYLSANAWSPVRENREIDSFVDKFCADRYDSKMYTQMLELWKSAMPFIKARHWNGPGFRPEAETVFLFSEYFFTPKLTLADKYIDDGENPRYFKQMLGKVVGDAPQLLRQFATWKLDKVHPFIKRDILDLIRAVASRCLGYVFAELFLAIREWAHGKDDFSKAEKLFDQVRELEVIFADLLGASDEYSLYASLQDLLSKKHACNPDFEYTLKGNAENNYCRTFITELFTEIYIPELDACREILRDMVKAGKWDPKAIEDPRLGMPRDKFYETPLKNIAPDSAASMKRYSSNLKKFAKIMEAIITMENDKK